MMIMTEINIVMVLFGNSSVKRWKGDEEIDKVEKNVVKRYHMYAHILPSTYL